MSPESPFPHSQHDHEAPHGHDHEAHDEAAHDEAEAPPLPVQVELSEDGPCRRRLKVTVASAAIEQALEDGFLKLDESAEVHGFRRGHVPREILQRRFGEALSEDVRRDLVGRSFDQAVKDKELKILGAPELDLAKIELRLGQDLSYEAAVEIRPDFPLPAYQGLKLEDVPAEVKDEQIENFLGLLQRRQADREVTADAARTEDVLIADVRILARGVEKPAWEKQALDLGLGEDRVFGLLPVPVPAMELLGVAAGTKKKVAATVPADTPLEALKPLAGQEVEVEIGVREVQRYVLPPLEDAFARQYGVESMTEMRQRARGMLEAGAQDARRQRLQETAVEQLLAGLDFPLPEQLVGRLTERDLMRGAMRLAQLGTPPEEAKQKLEASRAEVRVAAERRLRLSFLLDRIAEAEKIEPAEADLQEEVVHLAQEARRPVGVVFRQLEEEGRLGEIALAVRERKTLEWLVEHAEKKAPAADVRKP